MNNKELKPEEAYKALIDGKVIEKDYRALKVVRGQLKFRSKDGAWIDPERPYEYLLDLTGYHLARKKVTKEVRCWMNINASGFLYVYDSKKRAEKNKTVSDIATAVEMTGEYEVWEDKQ